MSQIYGALGLQDSSRVFLNTLGQGLVFDAVNKELARFSAELEAALGVFVERTTPDFKFRYLLPGGGRLQRIGTRSQAGAVKAGGSWDVAFPLEEFGAQIATSRVAFAYMTTEDLNRHVDTVFIQGKNTVRHEILKALFNSAEDTFLDLPENNMPGYGTLLVEPLANGDAVTYPALPGVEDPATDNHYLESGYAASAISDANNPYITIGDELGEHFDDDGTETVVFINRAQAALTKDLTDFDQVNDKHVRAGADADQVVDLPANLPGKVIGYTDGVFVVQWGWIPANYMLGINLAEGVPAPLIMRVDPEYTNLNTGLKLVGEDATYPWESSHYSHRFGVGAGNRINGVVMELGTGGTYSVPAAYA